MLLRQSPTGEDRQRPDDTRSHVCLFPRSSRTGISSFAVLERVPRSRQSLQPQQAGGGEGETSKSESGADSLESGSRTGSVSGLLESSETSLSATGDSIRPSDSPNRFGQFELARGVFHGKKHQGGVGLCRTGLSQGFSYRLRDRTRG
jgi:hypothetical protein